MKSTMLNGAVFKHFTRSLNFNIRLSVKEDLRNLEWFGLFTKHRQIIRAAYRRQERGQNLMLLAETNGFPIGQVWIDLERKSAQSTGILWAFRVIPYFQNLGIGTTLLGVAEQVLRRNDFARAELTVEKKDTDARRLYERTGFTVVGAVREHFSYTAPDGRRFRVRLNQWLLQKDLRPHRNGKILAAKNPGSRSSQKIKNNGKGNQHHRRPVDDRRRESLRV